MKKLTVGNVAALRAVVSEKEVSAKDIAQAYLEKIGYAADFYVVEIGDGPVVL